MEANTNGTERKNTARTGVESPGIVPERRPRRLVGTLQERRWQLEEARRERAWGDQIRMMRATVGMALGTERIPKPIELAASQRGWVYFVQASGGAIKIGRARNVPYRLAELQVAQPDGLTLLAVAVDGGREKEFHRLFAAHRLRGEWFAPHPDILAEIERLTNAV